MKSLICATILAIGLSSTSHAQERPSMTFKMNKSFTQSLPMVPGHYATLEAKPTLESVPVPDEADQCAGMFSAMQGSVFGQRFINSKGEIETLLDNGWTSIRSLDKPDTTIMRPPGNGKQTCVQTIMKANIPSGFQVVSLNAPYQVEDGIQWAADSVLQHIHAVGGYDSVSNCVAKEQELGIATAMGKLHLRLQYLQWLSI